MSNLLVSLRGRASPKGCYSFLPSLFPGFFFSTMTWNLGETQCFDAQLRRPAEFRGCTERDEQTSWSVRSPTFSLPCSQGQGRHVEVISGLFYFYLVKYCVCFPKRSQNIFDQNYCTQTNLFKKGSSTQIEYIKKKSTEKCVKWSVNFSKHAEQVLCCFNYCHVKVNKIINTLSLKPLQNWLGWTRC